MKECLCGIGGDLPITKCGSTCEYTRERNSISLARCAELGELSRNRWLGNIAYQAPVMYSISRMQPKACRHELTSMCTARLITETTTFDPYFCLAELNFPSSTSYQARQVGLSGTRFTCTLLSHVHLRASLLRSLARADQ